MGKVQGDGNINNYHISIFHIISVSTFEINSKSEINIKFYISIKIILLMILYTKPFISSSLVRLHQSPSRETTAVNKMLQQYQTLHQTLLYTKPYRRCYCTQNPSTVPNPTAVPNPTPNPTAVPLARAGSVPAAA